jgi:aryl-alcohol dehydrogenase-like predicted oxidoreductase
MVNQEFLRMSYNPSRITYRRKRERNTMAPDRKRIDRREFLKLGAAASALAVGGCASAEQKAEIAAEPEMRYRPLGNTGLKVSEVSFGAHGLDNPALLPAAIDAGINTFATSGHYMDGREEEALGEAISKLGGRRDELVILTGNRERPGATKQSILDSIDTSLRRLRTDRLEVYYNAEVRTPSDLRVEALFEAFEEARKAGKVLHLGISGHRGGMQACLNAAIEDGTYGIFFTKYDFASYPDQDEILRRASQKGIGTIVFKTGAGNREKEIKDLEAGGLSFRQAAVKWALSNPDVASVCVSFTNFGEIREYSAAVGATVAASEAEMLRRYADEMHDKYCRFCAVCEKDCPYGVTIADINRYAMYFKHYGREKESMRLYDAVPAESSAAACQECPGDCDSACPFGRRVREELLAAHRMLSFSPVPATHG